MSSPSPTSMTTESAFSEFAKMHHPPPEWPWYSSCREPYDLTSGSIPNLIRNDVRMMRAAVANEPKILITIERLIMVSEGTDV